MAEDVTVAEVEDWAVGLENLLTRIGPRFARAEPRARAGVYVRGLLSAAERKNGWTLAEQAGDEFSSRRGCPKAAQLQGPSSTE